MIAWTHVCINPACQALTIRAQEFCRSCHSDVDPIEKDSTLQPGNDKVPANHKTAVKGRNKNKER